MIPFITPEEYEKVQQGRLNLPDFNDILNRVYNKAADDALCRIPHILTRMLMNQASMLTLMQTFAKNNEDVTSSKEDMDQLMQALLEVETEHAGWDYEQILEESASRVRSRKQAIQLAEAADNDIGDVKPDVSLLDTHGEL